MAPAGLAEPLADEVARRRIREDFDHTLFVEAAAGTGKTTAVVSRIVGLLRSGRATLDRIVAVTFTEKAAGEMKLRLRAEIEHAREEVGSRQERERLDLALQHLELARTGTIHGFCADLLRERPVEAGVDPLFEVAAEDSARALLDEAFAAWFERVLEDPPEGVRRVLRRRGVRSDDGGPRALLRRAVEALAEHRDFASSWRRDPFERRAEIDRILDRLAEAAALAQRASRPDDWLAKSLHEIGRFLDENRLREAVRGRDYDALEAELRALASGRNRHWRWTGGRSPFGPDTPRDFALAARDGAKAELDRLLADCDADLAPRLRDELRPVIEAYERNKDRSGRLDFLDLLLRTRELLRRHPTVRRELQQRYTHLFVDEFQDTDPLQAEIVLLLSAGDAAQGAEDEAQSDWREVRPVPGKLFIVGDPKQSIYRFRRADVALYEQVKRSLLSRGAELLELGASFRALPGLQNAVNAAFAPLMQGSEDGSQARYVPLSPVREPLEPRPALVVLPVPRPYGDYDRIVKWRIDESFADAAGAFVDWLVRESGWTVEDPARPGSRARIEPRHVCLLFRRFQNFGEDVTRAYVRALEARRIPHVLVGGRSFHDREEVLAIRNALTAIEWPDDELRVFATLRGPLFGVADAALLAFRHVHRRLHPLRWRDPHERLELAAPEREVADALALLAALHVGRNQRPIAHTLARLLDAVRAHAGIAIWPTGEQALANCLRTIDLARRFERGGAPSFRAFVEFLEGEAERAQAADAPVVEEGTEGVRIMTVHRAKGLEFPVVLLADPTCNATAANPSRHVDPERGLWAEPLCGSVPPDLRDAAPQENRRDADEAVRVAYVAATRARDLLVVPGVGDLEASDELAGGWLEALNPLVYPPRPARRSAQAAPGCPPFGDDSVLERPQFPARRPPAPVKPGLHRSASGTEVVWWDPKALRLDAQEDVGLRQQLILAADEGEVATREGVEAHARWQAERSRALAAGLEPSLRVAAVTTLASLGAAAAGGSVELDRGAVDRSGRPGGRRFGALVHATLAAVDLEADAGGVRAVARTQGRLVGASEDELEAAVAAVSAALEHPLLVRAARAARRGELRRETPVLLQLDDGSLAEGVVDLAFLEHDDGDAFWTVVDFKTDRELEGQRERYDAQVRLYASAIARATGQRSRGHLLLV